MPTETTTSAGGVSSAMIEIHNQTPFPVKVYRAGAQGKGKIANVLAGYGRYVQEAALGEVLTVKLDCNDWTVATITADKSKRVAIGEDVLVSRPKKEKVSVTLDVPIRGCRLVRVTRAGKERALGASIDPTKPAPTLELAVGTVVKGTDPGKGFTYFWLIVTPAGQPNLLGQTFSTGTGWGVAPNEGEVVLFLDLALGKDAAYKPDKAPDRPTYLLCHRDVPDLAALLDSRLLDFPDRLRTADTEIQPGASAAAPSSLYDQIERFVPAKGKKRESAGVIVLAARVGPSTRAVFYEEAGMTGETYELDGGSLPVGRALRSLNLEVTRTAAQAGMRVLTSLSEDYALDQNDKLTEVTRFRVAVSFTSPAVHTVHVSSWEDDVEIIVDDETLVIGPNQPAILQPNAFGRLAIAIEPSEAGAPELLLWNNTMPAGTSVVVYPDEEMHHKMAGMADGALKQSGIVDAKYSDEDCAQVQQALQNVSRSVSQSYAETSTGVTASRAYDGRRMSNESWVLRVDERSGRPTFAAVSAAGADQLNAATSAEIRDADKDLAQGLKGVFKKAKKATAVVVKTVSKETEKAATTVAKKTEKAATTVAKETVETAEDVAKTKAGRALVNAGEQIGKGVEITIHYADKTAVRFIVRTARQAAAAFGAFLDMIEVALDKFVKWLRFVFDWGDIKRAQEVFAEAINRKLEKGEEEIAAAQKKLDDFFAKLKKQITAARGKPAALEEQREATDPTKNSAKEKAEWFFSLLTKKPKKKEEEKAKPRQQDKGLGAAMASAVSDMAKIIDGFGDLFTALGSGDTAAMGKAAKSLALDFAELGLDVVRALLDAILIAARKLYGVLVDAMQMRLNIPLLTKLYERFVGGELTIVNAAAFLLGAITTVFTKVFAGKAPFGPKASLVQSSPFTIASTATLAALDLVFAFLSSKSTVEAGTDPLSPKTYDLLWKIMCVLKLTGAVEAMVQPFVIKSDAAELFVSLSGSLNSIGQLILQIEPTNTRRAEIILDAFFGGALKFVAGGLEAGIDPMNGVVLFLEGTGAIAQLGGMVSNPDVYLPAAMVNVLGYSGASTARLIQLSA